MSQATICADIHQALYVACDVTSQVAFNLMIARYDGRYAAHLFVAQVFHPGVRVHVGGLEYLVRTRPSHAEDVRQPYFDPFLSGQVNA
jgi:hypothetical protein